MPTLAGESPGEWYFDETAFVVRVRHPQEALANAIAFLHSVSPMYSEYLLSDESDYRELTAHPALDAIDLDQGIFWGGYFDEQGTAVYYAVLHTRDGEALLTALEVEKQGLGVLRRDSEIVIASSPEVIDHLKKLRDGGGRSCVSLMSAEQRATFDTSDVAVFFNTKQVYTRIRRDVQTDEDARQELLNLLEPLVEWYDEDFAGRVLRLETVLTGINAVIDSSSVVVGGSIDKSGLAVEVVLEHDADKQTRKRPEYPLSNFQALRRIPPDRQCYALGTAPFPVPAGWFLEVVELDDLRDDEDAPKLSAQGELVRRIGKLNFGPWAAAVSFPTAISGEFRLDAVAQIEKPQAYRLMNNNLAVVQSQFKAFREKRAYELLAGSEQYGAAAADVHRVTYKTTDDKKEDYEAKLHGPDGLISRCLYDDNLFVNTVGGGQGAMEQALLRLRSQELPELPAELAATRLQLPTEGNFMLLVDTASILKSLMRLEANAGDDRGVFGEIARRGILLADRPKTYVGLAIVSTPARARAKFYLPSSHAASLVRTWVLGAGDLF